MLSVPVGGLDLSIHALRKGQKQFFIDASSLTAGMHVPFHLGVDFTVIHGEYLTQQLINSGQVLEDNPNSNWDLIKKQLDSNVF